MPPRKRPAPKKQQNVPLEDDEAIQDHLPYRHLLSPIRNQAQHPGDQHKKYDIVRRSKAEIQAADEAKAAAELAAKTQKISEYQAKVKKTASLKARIQHERDAQLANAIRSDLHQNFVKHHGKDGNSAKDDDVSMANEDEDAMDVPEDKNGWTSSELLPMPSDYDESDHSSFSMPHEGEDDLDDDDYDLGKENFGSGDEYHANSAVDDDEEWLHHLASGKAKCGALRSTITKEAEAVTRGPALMQSGAKRKSTSADPLSTENGKRMRGHEIGGLKSDWKKVVASKKAPTTQLPGTQQKAANKSSTSLASEGAAEGGEFDEEESAVTITAVRASKNGKRTGDSGPDGVAPDQSRRARVHISGASAATMKRTTAQMGIKLQAVNAKSRIDLPSDTKRAQSGSAKYSNINLPFNKDEATRDLTTWRATFMPNVYDWAGTRQQPWSTNSDVGFVPELRRVWCLVFPHLKEKMNDPSIEYVAAAALRTWRSDIGKVGVEAVDKFIATLHCEHIVGEVNALLTGAQFLYRDPNAPEGKRGAWLSDLFLGVFSNHLADTIHVQSTEYPLGAVCLCAASIERSLRLWSSGTKAEKTLFSDTLWGEATDIYAISAGGIDASRWETIFEECSKVIARSKMGKRGDTARVQTVVDYSLDPCAAVRD
ncbi:hypothetical protein HGRIS_012970 [Hohenbuehelia grisea]|uniref:DUF6532 domain-containing protein n=1 Tax=Hohenbuehelia grisea TaxID=104357 RepID=A0ABR3ITZ9_9AGAR